MGRTTIRTHARRTLVALTAALCAAGIAAGTAQAAAPLAWAAPVHSDSSPGTLGMTAVSCQSTTLCVRSTTPATSSPAALRRAARGACPRRSTAPRQAPPDVRLVPVGQPVLRRRHDRQRLLERDAGDLSPGPAGTSRAPPSWNGISCPTTTLCVAADNTGHVLVSTTPGTLTSASWPALDIDGTTHVTAVSCPTASLCAAVDSTRQDLDLRHSGGARVVAGDDADHDERPDRRVVQRLRPSASRWRLTAACRHRQRRLRDADLVGHADRRSGGSPLSRLVHRCRPVRDGRPRRQRARERQPGGRSPGLDLDTDRHGSAPADRRVLPLGRVLRGNRQRRRHAGGDAAAPVVATGAGTASTQTAATLGASVNPNDAALSDCHFDYGTTTAYGSSAACSVVPSATGGSQSVVASLTGLSAATTYHFRIVASSGVATTDGADASLHAGAAQGQPVTQRDTGRGQHADVQAERHDDPGETVAYAWLRDTVAIASAAAPTYRRGRGRRDPPPELPGDDRGDGASVAATSGFDAVPSQTLGKITDDLRRHRQARSDLRQRAGDLFAAGHRQLHDHAASDEHSDRAPQAPEGDGRIVDDQAQAGCGRTLSVSLNATGRSLLRSSTHSRRRSP